MGIEIEIKLKVDSHEPLRARLIELGATRHDHVEETNTFFDTGDQSLRRSGKGLRLRRQRSLDTGAEKLILTLKGPRQHGVLKSREEIELIVADAGTAAALLAGLGYRPTLTFGKRRESWLIEGCHVELDTLPPLGLFVEIEGPGESAVLAVRARLGLESSPAIAPTYAELLAAHKGDSGQSDR